MELSAIQKILKFFSLIKYVKKDFLYHVLQSIFRGFNPLIHIIFIEKIVHIITQNNIDKLYDMLFLYIGVIILYEIIWFLTRKIGWVMTIPKYETKIYEMYLKKYIQMDNNEVEKIGVGKTIAILENGRLRWSESLAEMTEMGIAIFMLLCYVFYVTITHGWFFSVGFMLLLILSISLLIYINNKQFSFRNIRSELRNQRLRHITKVLMSKHEVLQTNKIDKEINTVEILDQKTSQINKDMGTGRSIQSRLIPFCIGVFLFLFIYIYGEKVINGGMQLSEFVGITSIFLVINGVIINFIGFYVKFSKNFIDIQKMWDFFDNTPKLSGYDTGRDFEYKNGKIEFRNIIYGYSEGKNILNNFNFTINGQSVTALVGASGGGKTTIVKLIAGYIQSKKGEIIIDNQKLSEISLKSYYKYVGYLTQDPSVFDGSILENLTYAIEENVSDEKIKEIISLAKCEFIYELPNGLETQIGERGVKLSGGQKQRLAIAKIFLKDPKIIILDEPTSALDSFSEEQITKAMKNLFENRTVIVIAHRLQTVKHADRILVLENGKIIEDGKHDELVTKNGQYAKMLELQSGF